MRHRAYAIWGHQMLICAWHHLLPQTRAFFSPHLSDRHAAALSILRCPRVSSRFSSPGIRPNFTQEKRHNKSNNVPQAAQMPRLRSHRLFCCRHSKWLPWSPPHQSQVVQLSLPCIPDLSITASKCLDPASAPFRYVQSVLQLHQAMVRIWRLTLLGERPVRLLGLTWSGKQVATDMDAAVSQLFRERSAYVCFAC